MFSVGQKVVCLEAGNAGGLIKGEIYTILSVKDGCCHQIVHVGLSMPVGFDQIQCSKCGYLMSSAHIRWIAYYNFAPIWGNFADEVLSKAKEDGEILHQVFEQTDSILKDK